MDKTEKLLKEMKSKPIVSAGEGLSTAPLVILNNGQYKLDLPNPSGPVNCSTFQMKAGAAAAKVLTSDANGVGSWAALSGGDVSAAAVLTDDAIVRGDGGVKGVQTSGISIGDTNIMAFPSNKIAIGTMNTGILPRTNSIAIGTSVCAYVNDNSIAIGNYAKDGGGSGLAIGDHAETNNQYEGAIGYYVITDAATAGHFAYGFGKNFTNSVDDSVGFGIGRLLAYFSQNATVFNDTGANTDFRVEGDTDANLLVCDAGLDMVGIGMITPAYKLDVTGDINVAAANCYRSGGTAGVTGSFTTVDLKTVTVTKGIITAIA